MADRPYYSNRAGRGAAATPLTLDEMKQAFTTFFGSLRYNGYFQMHLGYDCVDEGFVPGLTGTDLETELKMTLHKADLFPIGERISFWSEDDLFDVIEFLYDNTAKPTKSYFHDYSSCGVHASEFDLAAGKMEYAERINRFLGAYASGFKLLENGEIVALPPTGLQPLMSAQLSHPDQGNVVARVESAIRKFSRRRANEDEKRDAVRDLADVLEFLRKQVKEVLLRKDEGDIFNIANNFGIRHHDGNQQTNYDKDIWLDWMFYHFLATTHAVVRLIEKSRIPAKTDVEEEFPF